MSLTKTTILTAAAAIAVLTMTGGAFAKTFEAIYTVSIHSHATKKSSIVDKLYEGERVKINNCDDDWCLISHDGPSGWVPLASLESVGGGYEGGATIVFEGGGFNYGHQPKPPIVVDPGPKHPKFPGQVGHLPTTVLDPGFPAGGGPKPVKPPKFPVGTITTGGLSNGGFSGGGNTGGNSGGNGGLCQVKPIACQTGGSFGGHPHL